MSDLTNYLKESSELLNIEYSLLLAITKVEAGSKGFIESHVPVVLFERHIFYRELQKQGFDVNNLSQQYPQLVNKLSGGYIGGSRENYRLEMAKQINEGCAIESTSYGLFQIMGFHWQKLNYDSPQDFEKQMCESELKQTEAFIRFISLKENAKMIMSLQTHDFATFAKLYNGPNYKKNRYDEKIKEAYDGYTKSHHE